MELTPFNFDISDLSPRHQRIFLAGVSGADGEPPADGEAVLPVEGADPVAADGEATADGEAAPEGDGVVVPDLPEDLAAADPEALRTLHEELGAAREAVRAQDRHTVADVEQIKDITARRSTIAAELQRRIDEAARVTADLTALDEELAAESALPEPEMALASVGGKPNARQIAAARGAQPRSGQQPPAPDANRPKAALMAAMGGGGVQSGDEITTEQLGYAFDRVKRGEGRAIVASIAPYSETPGMPEILGNGGDAAHNTALMREAQEEWAARQRGEAMTASICGPLDYIRTIPDAFVTSEPMRDVFPSRPIGHLGFQFIPSVVLSTVFGATAIWDEEAQTDVDPTDQSTWKVCVDVDCPSPTQIRAEAVTACLTWDITTEMSNPEYIANLLNALNAARARRKEGFILDQVDALSSAYTFDSVYGAFPTLVRAVNTAIAQVAFTNRIDEPAYTLVLPPGVEELLMIDQAERGYNSDTVTDVMAYLVKLLDGVTNVVSTLDAAGLGEPGLPFNALNPPGHVSIPLPSLESKNSGIHRLRLVAPKSALYGETGAMNVGTTRDSQLLRMNKTQYFAEEYLLLAKNGPEPWITIDTELCADGSRAGLLEPVGCES